MREDIEKGKVRNAHRCVINAFQDDGSVVNLAKYPKLARYFDEHAGDIKRRHVATKNPTGWFRTIDRVYPNLVPLPKLLIPDIAGSNEVVLESGRYHPPRHPHVSVSHPHRRGGHGAERPFRQ